MTPQELADTRRHVTRMSDRELGEIYVRGPGSLPAEAWQMLEEEVALRERSHRIRNLTSPHAATTDRSPDATRGEKSDILAVILSLLFGPVGLWYKGQWAPGFAWLAMAVLVLLAFGVLGLLVAPIFWVGMAVHAGLAKVKE